MLPGLAHLSAVVGPGRQTRGVACPGGAQAAAAGGRRALAPRGPRGAPPRGGAPRRGPGRAAGGGQTHLRADDRDAGAGAPGARLRDGCAAARRRDGLQDGAGDVVASGRAGLACDRAGIGAGAACCLRAPWRPSGGFPRRSIFSCGTVGRASFEWHRCCAPRRRLHAERSPRSGSRAAWSAVGIAVLGDGGLPTADRRRPRRTVDAAMCCDGGAPTT
mmetsp:Transcript_125909/g.403084  ORF Transcript_125909/g.403084 Transcript_125909/m.403084 type:complete len:218 (+) Transcript_125909:522-1175(+)